MELSPYLYFSGQCAAAFRFYEKTLGGKIIALLTHGETPAKDHVRPDWQDKIMHARLVVGDKALMGSDVPPEHFAKAQGMTVSMSVGALGDAERIFEALSDNGRITMPFQKTFWSAGFGMLVDQFGIPWMVNCDQQPA